MGPTPNNEINEKAGHLNEELQEIVLPNVVEQHDGEVQQSHVSEVPHVTDTAQDVDNNGLGRGLRDKYPPVKLHDYVTHTISQNSPSTSSSKPSLPSGTPFPIAHYVNCERFSLFRQNFLAAVTAGREPITFTKVMKMQDGVRQCKMKSLR